MDDPERNGSGEPERHAYDEPRHAVGPRAETGRLYGVIVLLLAVIAFLSVRPWTGAPLSSPAPDPTPPATNPARVTAPPTTEGLDDPYAGLEVTCGWPSGWRAATVQRWAGRDAPVRSWIAIEPVPASGPLDPAIPFAPVATDQVVGIGYCAPLAESERPPLTAVARLWGVGTGGPVRLAVGPSEPARPKALGTVWWTSPDGAAPWPHGRYVIEILVPDGGYRVWLGVDVLDLGDSGATASPSPGPSAPAPGPSGPAPAAS